MNFSVFHRCASKLVGPFVVAALLVGCLAGSTSAADPVDFNRDIRPILSDNCFECHGPDAEQRQTELRLDTREGLFRTTDEHSSVVPGDVAKSELFRRISSSDPDERMPPLDSGRMLTAEQISAIKQWIESGAEWQQHWSFVTPIRPQLPSDSNADWVKNPIDSFVLARLDQAELEPSEAADKRTLLRRVSFDLTGLPPTPVEIRKFLEDDSPDAYERVVDRLLKSPRYAERMTIRWLDAARYADTNGYQTDGPRDMWRWRDWVLEAFHKNMPFDQFTIEQLAGDLLPKPTLDQKIATGFNRNHRGNAEGGIVPEEFQVEYVVDRVDTTFTVWQGLTMGCARCHSHKFDPLTQKEYYRVFACFNNIPENGRALKEGNSPPYIQAPTVEHVNKSRELNAKLDQAKRDFMRINENREFEAELWNLRSGGISRSESEWTITEGELIHAALPESFCLVRNTSTHTSKHVELSSRKGFHRLQLTPGGQEIGSHAGPKGDCLQLAGKGWLEASSEIAKFGYFDRFSFGGYIRQEDHSSGTIISKMALGERGSGYHLQVTDQGTFQLNMGKRWLDDSLRVETVERMKPGRWTHVFVTYDGTRVADAVRFYIDGRPARHVANLDAINQSFQNDEPFRIGAGHSNFEGMIDDVRVFDRVLTAAEIEVVAEPRAVSTLLHGNPKQRGRSGNAKLREFILRQHEQMRPLIEARRALYEFERAIPTVMVMRETETPRETHVLQRGQYDRPGERVTFGTPAALPPLSEDEPANRLGLARWLVSRENPLTARVTVNRFWRDIFGTGIVKTTEDFGVQGEQPTHPELLDWLAVEFMESGWDVKRLVKTIVMSNTYRQASGRQKDESKRLNSDPENRLLSRGPRGRLSAEMIRDQALMASGLLTEQFGGPSVRPYQPEGLLKEIASDTSYEQDHGLNLYRRSLYTYWKRTVAPPMMTNFDASGREFCEVRRSRTNTPLQALNLLNDVTFVEAARVLAQNVLAIANDDGQRLDRIFERLLSRLPNDRERTILLAGLRHHRDRFMNDAAATNVLVQTGEWPVADELPPTELAAWTTICSTIMNLDEAVTKE